MRAAYLFQAEAKQLVGATSNLCFSFDSSDLKHCSQEIWDLVDATSERAQIDRVFAGEAIETAVRVSPSASMTGSPYQIEARRMDGPEGPMVLVTVEPLNQRTGAAGRDALTGLPDRDAARDQAETWLSPTSGGSAAFAVLFMDLNDFKSINDAFGHAAGDEVLRQLARRWQKCVRDGDIVCRYGGDEFLVLLRGVSSVEDAEPVMQRITSSTAQPIRTHRGEFWVTVAIGVALSAGQPVTLDELIDAADRDMYGRKRAGKPDS